MRDTAQNLVQHSWVRSIGEALRSLSADKMLAENPYSDVRAPYYRWYTEDWKDADLEAEGSWGITEIHEADGGLGVEFVIRGHKTFCPPEPSSDLPEEEWEQARWHLVEVAAEAICDAPGSPEWTGGDWVALYEERYTLTEMELPEAPDGTVPDANATARLAVDRLSAVMKSVGGLWAKIDDVIAEIERNET